MKRGKATTKIGLTLLSLLLWAAPGGWCTVPEVFQVRSAGSALSEQEKALQRVAVHASEFSALAAPLAIAPCGLTRPPEALATPDPLLQMDDENLRIRVSFIVGTDGRVYSPFILDSAGPEEDQAVLDAVRRWRYRPALCNGVPTDAEARVLFSNR